MEGRIGDLPNAETHNGVSAEYDPFAEFRTLIASPQKQSDASVKPAAGPPPKPADGSFLPTAGDHRPTINDGHSDRVFSVHVPKGYDGTSPLKVLYVMHGFLGNMKEMERETGLNEIADQRHFAVVYLQAENKGVPGTFGIWQAPGWNLDHGSVTDRDPAYNDLDYVKKVNDVVEKTLHVQDPKTDVFFSGFSEGGIAAQYIAEQIPCAGVATVNSTILTSDPRPIPAETPKKMMAILGDDDNFLPLHGGHGWFDGYRPLLGFGTITFPYVSRSVPLDQAKLWAQANGDTQVQETNDKHNSTTIWSGGRAPVEQVIHHSGIYAWHLQGGMHEWNDNKKQGWWALREADPTQNDSVAIANFFGL